MPYTKDTDVPVSRSCAEIDVLLAKSHVTDYAELEHALKVLEYELIKRESVLSNTAGHE